jgi:membrane-bound ClpP family serine protease
VALISQGAAKSLPIYIATDPEGKYQFENVAPGRYILQFQKQGFNKTNRTIDVIDDSTSAKVEVAAVQLQLTPLYQFLANLQAGSVVYVLLFGIATLLFNFYMVPEPSRGVTIAGWCFLGLAVLIAAMKLEWVDAAIAAVVGTAAASAIQRFGRKYAATRLEQEAVELSAEVAQRELERRDFDSLVGQEGITLTELKTCGSIRVAGRVVDARSGRGYVPPDTRVVVRRIEGKTPVVEVVSS